MAKRRRQSAEVQQGEAESHNDIKRQKTTNPVQHPDQPEKPTQYVLSAYFPILLTLRQYLIAKLSVLRRSHAQSRGLANLQSSKTQGEGPLPNLLDTALVGLDGDIVARDKPVEQDIIEATASSQSWTVDNGPPQSEVVDVAIRLLFARRKSFFPTNIITGGYKLKNGNIVSLIPNAHVQTLQLPHWQQLLRIVRQDVMLDMLLNACVFIPTMNDCFYQLMGNPISDRTPTLPPVHTCGQGLNQTAGQTMAVKRTSEMTMTNVKDVSMPNAKRRKLGGDGSSLSLSNINLARSKMFSTRPTINSHGDVTFGFRHTYLLNRYPIGQSKEDNVHVVQSIFPKQCGLSNVFTSGFKNYTRLDEEINALKTKNSGRLPLLPKRLRGTVSGLVAKLQKFQKGCPYRALLKYYCPVFQCDQAVNDKRFKLPRASQDLPHGSPAFATQTKLTGDTNLQHRPNVPNIKPDIHVPRLKVSFTDHASSIGEVTAFVHAIIGRVIPRQFFGGSDNQKVIMGHIDRFLRLRRFESLSLHDIIQGLKIKDFTWLVPNRMDPTLNISQPDKNKRTEILAEFLYWLFDCFIVPLISAHFYMSEASISNSQKIYYFRHDIWRKLSEPALKELKLVMFEEVHARNWRERRRLGHCGVRLLPKETGFRPIMNLGKKSKAASGPLQRADQLKSINAILQPLFSVLKYERNRDPKRVGSTIFNAREIYPKLKAFKKRIKRNKWRKRKLYFVKLDIQACFDTIPQKKLIHIIEEILIEEEYRLEFHAEVKPADYYGRGWLPGAKGRVFRQFRNQARGQNEFEDFEEFALRESETKRHVIFVDKVYKRYHSRQELLDLLKEHVQKNIVKIGNKFYRQKKGIPQGSVLSTILSGILYGALERDKLPFCTDPDGVLMRLVDDFLFITLNRKNATKFLTTMYNGVPEYGAKIGIEKCLVNFETSVNGNKINRLVGTSEFPYCGNTIHTKTLNFRKDIDRRMESNLLNSLTVISKNSGRALHQKTVKAFKMNADTMFLDVEHNSTSTVLTNIYRNFSEAGMKCYRYSKSLPRWKRPRQSFLIKIVTDILDFAYIMLKSRQKIAGNTFTSITESQVKWLGASAFFTVFERKQTGYSEFLKWLSKVKKENPANSTCFGVAAEGKSTIASRRY